MRAAVVYEHGGLDRIINEPDYPEPHPKPRWVKIRVRACSVNYHDIFSRRGMPGIKLPLPLIIGSDIAGVVAAVGEGVEGWSEGDRVLIDPHSSESGKGMIGEMCDGGRAEFCLAHESQLIPIPDSVSFDVAACIPIAYATAHRMLLTRGGLSQDDTVLVMGASGGVGTACVLIAKMVGATVIACASSQDKLGKLQEIRADHCINYVDHSMREAVWDIVGKPRVNGTGGVDLVVNYSGGGTWIDSIRCMKKGGRLVTCGATAGYEERLDLRYIWTFQHSLLGSYGWDRTDIVTLLEYARDEKLVPVIDRTFPLSEVREAERWMEDRKVFGKIVLNP